MNVSQLDGIVDKVYVINMDRDTDRLTSFHSEMADWHYERFSAINIKDLDPIELQQLKSKYIGGWNFLRKSEIGCLFSHVALWEKVATDPLLNSIIVFEDDARSHLSPPEVQKLLRDFYQYIDTHNIDRPDMLYLGKALDACLQYTHVWNHVYNSTHPLCLHAYLITKRGAQELLKLAPYNRAIDLIPTLAISNKAINVMTFHPSLYFQDVLKTVSNLRSTTSTINNITECLTPQPHMASSTMNIMILLAIMLIACIILCLVYTF